jgi:hypothetical protein
MILIKSIKKREFGQIGIAILILFRTLQLCNQLFADEI